ncbi:hypothetical protein ACFXD5_01460 [Streptomyces sp. NPDC059385]|uniref:hypothetical protein n=1 Tax=Streptomyces sp. NPDC059385 TaxID=3346817 RepID=UPI00369C5C20
MGKIRRETARVRTGGRGAGSVRALARKHGPRLAVAVAAPAGAVVVEALPLWLSAVLFALPGVLALLRPDQQEQQDQQEEDGAGAAGNGASRTGG